MFFQRADLKADKARRAIKGNLIKSATTSKGCPRNPIKCLVGPSCSGKKERNTYPLASNICLSKVYLKGWISLLVSCVWFSMKQVSVTFYSMASMENLQGGRCGVHGTGLAQRTVRLHLHEAGQSLCSTAHHSSGWNERQVKLMRSEMVYEYYLIQSFNTNILYTPIHCFRKNIKPIKSDS